MGIKRAEIRLYGDLNELAWDHDRAGWYQVTFDVPRSVKDVIESLGVPHTEVDLVVVDGASVGFDHLVRDGAHVAVYPPFSSLAVDAVTRVRPDPPAAVRFVADVHLGTLSRYLRLLGFDTWYRNDTDDAELAAVSVSQERILLTRDRGLLMRREVRHGYCPRSDDPVLQAIEVVRRFTLYGALSPYTRCPRCNGPLVDVTKEEVADRIPAGTRRTVGHFRRCTDCGQVYWRGAHHHRIGALIDRIESSAPDRER